MGRGEKGIFGSFQIKVRNCASFRKGGGGGGGIEKKRP